MALSAPSAQLLVNTVNDMRVNRLYIGTLSWVRKPSCGLCTRKIPGCTPRTIFASRRNSNLGRYRPLHHDYVDAVVPILDRVRLARFPPKVQSCRVRFRAALRKTWRDIEKAAACDAISQMLAILEKKVVPAYADLVSQWKPEELIDAASNSDDRESSEDDSQLPKERNAVGQRAAPRRVRIWSGGFPRWRGVIHPADQIPAEGDGRQRAHAVDARFGRWGRQTWRTDGSRAAVYRSIERRGRSTASSARPTNGSTTPRFDYIEAVSRLEPKIAETIDGDGRRPGLAEIMDRRRHGSSGSSSSAAQAEAR